METIKQSNNERLILKLRLYNLELGKLLQKKCTRKYLMNQN